MKLQVIHVDFEERKARPDHATPTPQEHRRVREVADAAAQYLDEMAKTRGTPIDSSDLIYAGAADSMPG